MKRPMYEAVLQAITSDSTMLHCSSCKGSAAVELIVCQRCVVQLPETPWTSVEYEGVLCSFSRNKDISPWARAGPRYQSGGENVNDI